MGAQPQSHGVSRATITAAFPRLKRHSLLLTSPPTPAYNCIGWAAEDPARFWWPDPQGFAYWPAGVSRTEEIPSFVAAFALLGYAPCADGSHERQYQKLAIFADQNGKPTHMARQLKNGQWTSKLGREEDIAHSIYGLESGRYGNVVQYLKRPIGGGPPSSGNSAASGN